MSGILSAAEQSWYAYNAITFCIYKAGQLTFLKQFLLQKIDLFVVVCTLSAGTNMAHGGILALKNVAYFDMPYQSLPQIKYHIENFLSKKQQAIFSPVNAGSSCKDLSLNNAFFCPWFLFHFAFSSA